MKYTTVRALAAICGALITSQVLAKVPADKASQLDGPTYTCIGSERAGNPASGIPEYSGKYQGKWPGMKARGFDPGPYANEKPLFSITAANMSRYADKLTEGQKALLKKYPNTYRMDVYPTHRDFKDADIVCERTKKNALKAELVSDGKGVSGTAGAIPFPFPQNGLEGIWNLANSERVWTQSAVCDIADVYGNGTIAWGRHEKFTVLTLNNDPKAPRSYQDHIAAHFHIAYMLPQRDKGFVVVGYQPNEYTKEGTMSWQYQPGLRRVRQAPEIGFDYPTPPAGLRVTDDDHGFNGSPERYTWKLVGKKEMYVPWDNFRVNDPAVKYTDLIKQGTVNPDYMRYELRRVWVIEGTLKDGVRHLYERRVLYADEDSWLAAAADNYDGRGLLWRVSLITYFFSQEGGAWLRGASLYHDLSSGAYEAGYLTNETGDFWKVNTPMTPVQFTPAAALQAGH